MPLVNAQVRWIWYGTFLVIDNYLMPSLWDSPCNRHVFLDHKDAFHPLVADIAKIDGFITQVRDRKRVQYILSNYTRNFLWDLLTHPFSTFKAGLNLTAVEFRAWMGNRSPLFYVECIYYGPIIQSFEGVFGGGPITALNKQTSGRWNEMHTRTCDVTVIRPAYV